MNIIYNFIQIVNNFCNVLGYSLPTCDLRLHAEYKYTMVKINTHFNVLVDGKFLVVALFQRHSLGIPSIR